jgi:hypothetical protein
MSYSLTPIKRRLQSLFRRQQLTVVALGLLVFFAGKAAAQQTLYAISGSENTPSVLYTIDPATGAYVSTIGATGYSHLTSIAIHPATGVMYGFVNSSDSVAGFLVTINTTSGVATPVGNVAEFYGTDMTFSASGKLYIWTEPEDDLYTLDLSNGDATLVGDCDCITSRTGLAFNAGQLYMKDAESIHRVDPANGQILSSVAYSSPLNNMLASDLNNVLYSGTRGPGGAGFTLQTIDPATGDVSAIGGNALNNITALAFRPCTNPSCSITVKPSNKIYTGGIPTNIYLGYGPQKATLTAAATGAGAFSYKWSGSAISKLSCTTCKSPVFKPTAPGTYTFTVTISTPAGCASTCSVTFCVKDIRVPDKHYDDDDDDHHYSNNDDDDDSNYSKYKRDNCDDDDDDYNRNSHSNNNKAKVYLCHKPYYGSPYTIAVKMNTVAYHLASHPGDQLGKCNQSCGPNRRMAPAGETVSHEAAVYPNPSNGSFVVELPYAEDGRAQITVTDVQGRLVQRRSVSDSDGRKIMLNLGDAARGVYFIEVVYGDQRFRTKLQVQ